MPNSTWEEMLRRVPTALDTMEARAQRQNDVLGVAPQHVPTPLPTDNSVESSNSPRQLQAQAAFDAHMAELARLKAQAEAPGANVQSNLPTEFDDSGYTTYKRP